MAMSFIWWCLLDLKKREEIADIGEFADYLFGKIKMKDYLKLHAEGPPTIH